MRSSLAPLLFLFGLTLACNAIVGYQDFEKTPNPIGGDDGDGTSSSSSGKAGGGGGAGAAGVDAGKGGPGPGASCDETKDFGAPVALTGPVNGTGLNGKATLTTDELTIVFQRSTTGTNGKVVRATRTSTSVDFGAPAEINELAQVNQDRGPGLRADGLFLFWAEQDGDRQIILLATRATSTGLFESPGPFQDLSSTTADDEEPFPTADGTELFFSSDRAGGLRLHHMTTKTTGWNAPTELTELSSNGSELRAALTHDALTMYFASSRSGGLGKYDIYEAKRPDKASKFANIKAMTSLNSAEDDIPSWVSADRCRLYLTRASSAGTIMVATRAR